MTTSHSPGTVPATRMASEDKQEPADELPEDTEEERTDDSEKDDSKHFYDNYLEYNKVLRAWFAAFGVGGPVLLLVNPAVAARLREAGDLKMVAWLFLAGVACQVLGALVNKTVSWATYYGERDKSFQENRWYKRADRISRQFWIDMVLDALTVISFGLAACVILLVHCE